MANDEISQSLATLDCGTLAKQGGTITIGELERRLLGRFPADQAESWDRTGLLAGDASAPVVRVAVALDATLEAIDAAAELGANVLLTHHPAFLDAPGAFGPDPLRVGAPGAVVYRAISSGIALMNFHTAFDVSAEAQSVLAGMLGLVRKGVIEPIGDDGVLGYGQLCEVAQTERPMTLGQLGARCTAVFGRPGRIWGAQSREVASVVCANGAAGSLAASCAARGIDCLVCGEVKYHAALEAVQAGLSIIELGHDVSELPYVGVLCGCVVDCGIEAECVCALDQTHNWGLSEAIRL